MLFCCAVSESSRESSHGHPHNQLLNEDSLADTGTTEETNLSTTSVGSEQVDDLDTSDENLSRGGLVDELRGVGVDGGELGGLDGTALIDGVTSDVDDTAQSAGTDGDLDGRAGVKSLSTTDETLRTCLHHQLQARMRSWQRVLTVHGNAADDVLTQVLLQTV